MEQFIDNFVKDASIVDKCVFLMVAGISFVFAVQMVFYLVVKLWTRKTS
jgi:Na+-transporting methylmalonyl-CoA/oxaloacetate decarboxylase gamma subunit